MALGIGNVESHNVLINAIQLAFLVTHVKSPQKHLNLLVWTPVCCIGGRVLWPIFSSKVTAKCDLQFFVPVFYTNAILHYENL